MQIAICLPSRGMLPSKTLESVVRATQGLDVIWSFTHGVKLPDAYNKMISENIGKASYFMFIDDDMGLPEGIIREMLSYDVPIVTANYPVTEQGGNAVQVVKGYTLGGFGCLLVKSEVLKAIQLDNDDYLRCSTIYTAEHLKPMEIPRPDDQHGGHDVDFYIRSQDAGYEIKVAKGVCTQYKLITLNGRKGNDKPDKLMEWTL